MSSFLPSHLLPETPHCCLKPLLTSSLPPPHLLTSSLPPPFLSTSSVTRLKPPPTCSCFRSPPLGWRGWRRGRGWRGGRRERGGTWWTGAGPTTRGKSLAPRTARGNRSETIPKLESAKFMFPTPPPRHLLPTLPSSPPPQVLATLCATLGCLLNGAVIGYSSPTLPSLLTSHF